uniref:Signal peptide peptidase-like 3 n=1 Tax=Pinguiococcus pyrenoidosus TaxID=172671 RepID=A0A7R9UBP9_9STRA|mmetsp:Transcript_4573/g.18020  ORF Transcript_4573/g.18020 Transcript_4573/m.18020 type:complete len:209 (+) Transcript_4573:263-889(+)
MEILVTLATEFVAVGTIFLGSLQSFQVESWFNDASEPRGVPEVTGRAACMFPILGSASLLLLFFAFQMLSDFLVLYLAVSSYAAVYACASGFLERSNLSAGVQSGSSTILALGLVVAWICTNHFLFIDGIGFCLCVTMISLLRLNSLRVGAIAGLVLFIYDTFWVFFSHLIFRENVMVKVATQQATNPVYNMATAANLPGRCGSMGVI